MQRFLLEYNREISQKTVGKRLTEIFNFIFSTNLPMDKVYDFIEEIDPTPKNEYVEHIIRWFLEEEKTKKHYYPSRYLKFYIDYFQKKLKIYDDAKKKNLLKRNEKTPSNFKTIYDFIDFVNKEVAPRVEKEEERNYFVSKQTFSKNIVKYLSTNKYTNAAIELQKYINDIGVENITKRYKKAGTVPLNLRKLNELVDFLMYVFTSRSFQVWVGYEDTKKIQHWLKNIKKFIDSYDKCIFFIRDDHVFVKSKFSPNIIFGFWVLHFNKPTWDENDESHLEEVVLKNTSPKGKLPYYDLVKTDRNSQQTRTFYSGVSEHWEFLEL